MSGTVLCAVDINRPETEKRVVEKAAQLAALEGAQLDVIAVVPDFGLSMVGQYFDSDHTDKVVAGAKETLEAMVADVIGAEANAKVRHIIAIGTPYEEVLKTAKKAKSTLIVLGAHKPEFRDYLLGPNSARVVRHSECSVHVVR